MPYPLRPRRGSKPKRRICTPMHRDGIGEQALQIDALNKVSRILEAQR